jgi:hypothetical protein
MKNRRSFAWLRLTLFHPTRPALVGFASGEAFDGRDQVARHLERCTECRQLVGFAQRLERAAAALPPRAPGDALLERALADRAAGARLILPAPTDTVHDASRTRTAAIAATVIAAAIIGVWWSGRTARVEFTSGELLLAGLVPRSAEAAQAGHDAGPLTHRLRPLSVTYQRRFIDSASHVTDAGKFDLRVQTDAGNWVVTSSWREIEGRADMQNARSWAESVTVADSSLAPSRRVVHVKPYRRWAGIYINQGFRGDSVVGQMSLDEDPTRRPIAQDLRAQRGRLIASDAVAPLYFMGVPLLPGAAFDVSILGWAVVPNDVLVSMRMRVEGSERVETPVGGFDCWKLAITVGRDTHHHWVRKSDHLGVLTRRRMSDGRTREIVLAREGDAR